MLQDIRFALRSFMRNPGFAALAVFALALGIGANTAIFSVLDAVVLQPLSYHEPETLVRIGARYPFTQEILGRFQRESRSFAGISGYTTESRTLLGDGSPRVLPVGLVSSGHFDVLGMQPAQGRAFLPQEQTPAGDRVVILSHGLWQREFAGDPEILGKTIVLRGRDGDHRTVVGIMDAGHRPLMQGWQAWAPHIIDPASHRYSDMSDLTLVARLAPETSLAGAREEIGRLGARFRADSPDHFSEARLQSLQVTPLLQTLVKDIRPTLLILQAAVGLVLLIGCANVMNLLLARSTARAAELAVRSALGAGRGRLVRQLLTESALLGLAGGGLGLLLADASLALLSGRLPAGLPRAAEIAPDWRTTGFALAAGLLCSLIFGLAPALRLTGSDLQSWLRESGRGSGSSRQRLNGALVAAEIALSVVLLASAGLMLKSFWKLQQVELGFQKDRLLTMQLMPPATRYPDDAQRQQYYRQVLENLRAVPGVLSAEAVDSLPLTGGALGLAYLPGGRVLGPQESLPFASYRAVTAGYLEQMEIPILQGRGFTPADRAGRMEVGILNHAMAEHLWPGEDPIGKEIRWDAENPWFRVVGVVADIKQERLADQPYDVIYRPYELDGWRANLFLTLRTQGEPTAVSAAARDAIWQVDAEVPLLHVRTMEQVVQDTLAQRRFITSLLVGSAALAMLLAGLGVYGVTSYAVSRRTREIGVRMALGATYRSVLANVMARGARTALLGVAVGLVGALATMRALSGMLFQVDAGDPGVLLGVGAFLALVALAATYLPARRAARLDPLVALRTE